MSFKHSNAACKGNGSELILTTPLYDADIAQRIRGEIDALLSSHMKEKVPLFNGWIDQVKLTWREHDQCTDLYQLHDLTQCFPKTLLDTTRAIPVDCCPDVPYEDFGLGGVRMLRGSEFGGLACGDFYFIKASRAAWQPTHFHELIHIIQWKILGPEAFLGFTLLGLSSRGYLASPLEKMAYSLQDRFGAGRGAFDAVAEVYGALRKVRVAKLVGTAH